MDIKRDPVLWVALGIPVLMMVLVAAGIFLPRFFVKPLQYSFLYMVSDNKPQYNVGGYYAYKVSDYGKLDRYLTD